MLTESRASGFTLQIAGARFRLSSPGPLPVAAPVAAYAPFLLPGEGSPPGPAASVTLHCGAPELPPPGAEQLLSVADSWSLHRTADSCLITMSSGGAAPLPLWSARCRRDFSQIELLTNRTLRQGVPPRRHLLNCLQYPLDQILLMHLLAGAGLIIHAGAATRAGRAVIFAGVSGAGKTTLARLLDRSGFALLSDDRVVARREDAAFSVWGTPWPGEGGYARNERAPLAALLFLEKGPRNLLRRLSAKEALARLLPVLSVPWYDARLMDGPLSLAAALLAAVPCHAFTFTPGTEAAQAIGTLCAG